MGGLFESDCLWLPFGAFIGHSYDGTVMPLLLGFILCSLASIVLVFWTEMKGNASKVTGTDT